ncbi:MAG: UvrD-helicase domain-containing protein [Butyrivibrio sp.]|nr:UvrD-helicase domain-containing protein [Butyrivibrio sp.]
MDDVLKDLNKEQIEAVTTTEGYVRVIAGAGSGKTKALTHRYAYLVNELGISTANILCATFTNKAANEMKKRIRTMIGDSDTGYVCTFHGMGVQILREDIHVINYPQNFVVMDGEDMETILKTIYENCNIQSRTFTFTAAHKAISTFKRNFLHVPYLAETNISELKNKYDSETDIEKKVVLGYIYEQKKNYGLDYDDLITVTLHILRTNEEKRKKWQKRMMYVMVDEFQDVSSLNLELANILSAYHKNLFVVGDPDQTIYSFRGADIKYILDFDKKHDGVKTIKLNKNYRSTPEILNAANSLIKKNTGRIPNELIATREPNVLTVYNHSKTTRNEAEWIIRQIKSLVDSGIKYSDITILYRAHFVSRSLEEVFLKEKIPYVLYSGIEFYKRKEIKDILSYMRMIIYADDLSFQRVVNEPKRNIGRKRLAFLSEYADEYNCSLYTALKDNIDIELMAGTGAGEFIGLVEKYNKLYKEMRLSDIFTGILNDSGYEAMLRAMGEDERLENLAELKESIFIFEKTSGEENSLEDYLQTTALFTNTDKEDRKDAVKMMTIHIAKGLEFPYVFICGLNEGIFPTKHANTTEAVEEERRLAYVAYTRAENALFLTDSEGVNYDGSFRYPSRFIFNTDREFLNYEVELEESLINHAKKYIETDKNNSGDSQMALNIGDSVEHKVFGLGKILGINKDTSSYIIKFNAMATERSISFRVALKKVNGED